MNKTQLKGETVAALKKLAAKLGLRGAAKLTKPELVEAISKATAPVKKTVKRKVATKRRRVVAAGLPPARDASQTRLTRASAPVKGAATLKKQEKKTALKIVRRKRVAAKPRPRKAATAKVTPPRAPTAPNGQELVAHKFELPAGEKPQIFPPLAVDEQLGELPDAYGTGRLFLTARDPHWLYAYWDLTWQQMADYRGQSSNGQLVLRIFEKNHARPIQELALHHDVRNWYLHIGKAATTFTAQLGFWQRDGHFHVIGHSREATTPADSVSKEATARFVTVPLEFSFADLIAMIGTHLKDGEKLAEALHRLQATGFQFPFRVGVGFGPLSAQQAAEMERILGGDLLRRIQIGSFEISEWLRRRLQEQLGSAMFSASRAGGSN